MGLGATVLTVTENGYGKRSAIEDYQMRSRGGLGVITIQTTERNGMVVGLLQVTDDDHIMLITDQGMLIRLRARDIRVQGRNTQGVRLISMKSGERVVSVARLAEEGGSDGGSLENHEDIENSD